MVKYVHLYSKYKKHTRKDKRPDIEYIEYNKKRYCKVYVRLQPFNLSHLWVYDAYVTCKSITFHTFKRTRLNMETKTAIFKVIHYGLVNRDNKVIDINDDHNLIVKFTDKGWDEFYHLILNDIWIRQGGI